MSRFVFCGICDTNLGVLFERDAEHDSPAFDFLPHDDCWHVSRQQLVEDLEALRENRRFPYRSSGLPPERGSYRLASGRPPTRG